MKTNPSALRISAVLHLLAHHADVTFTLAEITRHLGFNKSTIHTLLMTLVDTGMLEKHSDSSYSLGREMVVFGQAALSQHRAVAIARREMNPLAAATGLNCGIAIVSGQDIVSLGNTDPQRARPVWTTPLVPPFGSVFLAWSEESEIEQWLARAGPISNVARARLLRALKAVRSLGFQMTHPIDRIALNLEFTKMSGRDDTRISRAIKTIVGDLEQAAHYLFTTTRSKDLIRPELISAPVFDQEGKVVLAMALSGFKRPMASREIRSIVGRLRSATKLVTNSIGGNAPVES